MKLRRLLLAGMAAPGAFVLLARPRYLRWGATEQEIHEPLLGDDLLAHPDLASTRAITIRAPVEQVWPWVAQLGQGRGGFYSYDFLENIVGCQIHSAKRIVPEWQAVAVGDEVRLHPGVPLRVAAVEPGRALVLRGGVPMGETPPPYDFTWTFALDERPDGTTRLLVRERYAYTRWWGPLVVELVETVSFMMTQKMLRGIRDRAEGRTD
ncbi:MAG: SRPBCC family protein [Thermoleophilia bacterium]|nr:SRPBCC family protein [Thermoleophilia bacterium]